MVTLEISSTDIRLIEVNGRKIVKWASWPLEPAIFSGEIVSDAPALGSALKELMASSGIKDKNVIASVSGLFSLSRIVAVPGPADQPITEQAVLQAIEEVMPISTEELYVSWQPMTSFDSSRQVLAVGVPRDMIDGELRALKSAGVNSNVLDLKTLALARAVNRSDAIVLNIDATSFDIVILNGGNPEVLRTTAWQPETLNAEERAEQLISATGLTAGFYNSHHPGAPLDPATPLFITGHLSADAHLTGLLKEGLGYPFEPLAPPLEHPEDMPVAQYAVNIGLAMKASAAPRLNLNLNLTLGRKEPAANTEAGNSSVPDLNLLPQAYKPWRPSTRQVLISLAVVTTIALLIPFYKATIKEMGDTATVKQRYDAVNTALLKRQAELAKREPLLKSIDQYKAIVATGGNFVDDLAAIRQIATALDVQMQGITHNGGSVSFSCEAADYVTFRLFIKALGDNGRFTVASVPPEGYPYIKGGAITLKPKK